MNCRISEHTLLLQDQAGKYQLGDGVALCRLIIVAGEFQTWAFYANGEQPISPGELPGLTLSPKHIKLANLTVRILGDNCDGVVLVEQAGEGFAGTYRRRIKLEDMALTLKPLGDTMLDAAMQAYDCPQLKLEKSFGISRFVERNPNIPVNFNWNTQYGASQNQEQRLCWVFSDGDVRAKINVNGGDRFVNLNHYDLLSWYSGYIHFLICDASWAVIVERIADQSEFGSRVMLVAKRFEYNRLEKGLDDYLCKSGLRSFKDWLRWFI